jgi:hypothetical protein
MRMQMEVFCRTRFVGFHVWKDAPNIFAYLRNTHRHEFHVEVGVHVELSNREVEFHELRLRVDDFLKHSYPLTIELSCELMASQIAAFLRQSFKYDVTYVEVSEDGECGGRVRYAY